MSARRKSPKSTSTGGRYSKARMHISSTRCAILDASPAIRFTRSGWRSPAGSWPVPPVARLDQRGRELGALDPQGRAQRLPAAGGIAELTRQLDQRARGADVPARPLDVLADDVGEGEVLEERDDVRESFVEGEDVLVR